MPPLLAVGGPQAVLSLADKRQHLQAALAQLGYTPKRVLLLPPDITRLHSDAGTLTPLLYELLAPHAHVDVLPALGTHVPMSTEEIHHMFGTTIPLDRYLVHDWRHGLSYRGEVPGELVREWSGGKVDYGVRIEVNRHLVEGGYDLILSVGQVVPHEVVGMANYTKNVVVGVGGVDTINKTHFLGAVCNMERLMGRVDTPVRRVFNYGATHFLGSLPIVYVLTVMDQAPNGHDMLMRGLYVGKDDETFALAARLSRQVNLTLLDRPVKKAVVYLDPAKYRSTWLGNKAIYRTRMVIADGGELLILAPGLRHFGEDPGIDALIRQHGYRGTPATLAAVKDHADLRASLSAAAHLIHGSSEGRFTITYAPGPALLRAAIEAAGFASADLDTMLARYTPLTRRDGCQTLPDGEEIFFVGNPAVGLWALKSNFAD